SRCLRFVFLPSGHPRRLHSFPTRRSSDLIDRGVVDGLTMGSASLAGGLSAWLRTAQNGYVRTYGLTLVIGIVALAAIVFFGQLRSEEHTSELQSRENLVCRLLLEKKKNHS